MSDVSVAKKARRTGRRLVAFRAEAKPKTLAFQVFGVRTVESEPAKVRGAVSRGVLPSKVAVVQRLYGFSQNEMAKVLGLTPRTMTRKRQTRSRFGAEASDNTARLVRAFDRATSVLGSRDRATEWLRMPNMALGGDVPRTWLDTDAGTAEVLRLLGRVEHGIYS
ncbi:MAG: DUF2384 domain-containing protein [Deltaproteobacteria bacterium]|nr:DUF2384 domain-containing protein [Deltaproteobacteria bacterium]